MRPRPVRALTAAVAATLIATLAPAGAGATPQASTLQAPEVQARPWVPAAPARIEVQTEGNAPIVSKDNYVNATMTYQGVTHELEIKGRGNSTWGWPKKPYKIKLAEDAALLGTTPQEDWVLLANYRDRSALRTSAAFALASETTLAWTPQSRHVELVLNGEPQGLYLLTEQVEAKDDRVELPDDGYLLEINERFLRDDEPGFRSRRRTPVTFKDPDEVTRRQRKSVKAAVEAFEDVLYSRKFTHPTEGYRSMVDVQSFIDWYLVEEFFMNQDSNFQSSVNVTLTPEGTFAMGPVWDFDLSAGSRWQIPVPPTGWHTRNGNHWIARMLADPSFSLEVKQRWRELRPIADRIVGQIQAAAAPLRRAAEADWKLWHNAATSVGHAPDFAGEVDFLEEWLRERAVWMSGNESTWGEIAMQSKERERTVWLPIRLLEPATEHITVDYSYVPGGTATRGQDFTMDDGAVEFTPGTLVRYVPIRIHADEEAEPAEHLQVRLSSSDPDAIIGSPAIATVSILASDQSVDVDVRGRVSGSPSGLEWGDAARPRLVPGMRTTLQFRVHNTGTATNRFRLRADRPARGVTFRWFLGKRDVTAKILRHKGVWVQLAPGAKKRLRLRVEAGPGSGGQRMTSSLRATWKGDIRVDESAEVDVRVLKRDNRPRHPYG